MSEEEHCNTTALQMEHRTAAAATASGSAQQDPTAGLRSPHGDIYFVMNKTKKAPAKDPLPLPYQAVRTKVPAGSTRRQAAIAHDLHAPASPLVSARRPDDDMRAGLRPRFAGGRCSDAVVAARLAALLCLTKSHARPCNAQRALNLPSSKRNAYEPLIEQERQLGSARNHVFVRPFAGNKWRLASVGVGVTGMRAAGVGSARAGSRASNNPVEAAWRDVVSAGAASRTRSLRGHEVAALAASPAMPSRVLGARAVDVLSSLAGTEKQSFVDVRPTAAAWRGARQAATSSGGGAAARAPASRTDLFSSRCRLPPEVLDVRGIPIGHPLLVLMWPPGEGAAAEKRRAFLCSAAPLHGRREASSSGGEVGRGGDADGIDADDAARIYDTACDAVVDTAVEVESAVVRRLDPVAVDCCCIAALPDALPAASVSVTVTQVDRAAGDTSGDPDHEDEAAVSGRLRHRVVCAGCLVALPARFGRAFLRVTETSPPQRFVRVTRTTRFVVSRGGGSERPPREPPRRPPVKPPAASPTRQLATPPKKPFSFMDADLSSPPDSGERGRKQQLVCFRDLSECGVGGLDSQFATLRETLVLPHVEPELFRRLGLSPPNGVLLHGPHGVGKSVLAAAAIEDASDHVRVRVFELRGADVLVDTVGESERRVRAVFSEARAYASQQQAGGSSVSATRRDSVAVVLIEDIEEMCPRREDSGSVASRVVAQLLTLLDGVDPRGGRVVVIGTTTRPNALDPALRRPGRLDREVRLAPPGEEQRAAIVAVHAAKLPMSATVRGEFLELARAAVGYVGADLASVCRKAALSAMSRDRERASLGGAGGGDVVDPVGSPPGARGDARATIEIEDCKAAFAEIPPSALRGVTVTVPTTRWDDIGGVAQVKRRLQQAVEWPLLHADAFARLGLQAPRGVLLYGPPGCSKTTLVRAAACAARATFFSMSGADIYSPYVGEAERTLRLLFQRARDASPAIIFLDEIDAMVAKRDMGDGGGEGSGSEGGVLSTLLNEMDGVESAGKVLVVAATNRPSLLDAALLRPGRLEVQLLVPLPDLSARREILHIHTRALPLAPSVDLDALAASTDGLSGAELEAVCREAAMLALREDISTSTVSQAHLVSASKRVRPAATAESLAAFDRFSRGLH